jgi:hypothetical protein
MGAAVEEELWCSGGARVRAEEEERRCTLKRKKENETADGSVKKNSDPLFKG